MTMERDTERERRRLEALQSFAIIVEGRIVCSQTVEETLNAGDSLEDLFFKHVVRGKTEQLEWIG